MGQEKHGSDGGGKWYLLLLLIHSVVSDSLQPHGLQPTRLLCPWDSPGKNPGVGCHFLLQGIFLTQESNPVSCTAGRSFTSSSRATREAPELLLIIRLLFTKHCQVWMHGSLHHYTVSSSQAGKKSCQTLVRTSGTQKIPAEQPTQQIPELNESC